MKLAHLSICIGFKAKIALFVSCLNIFSPNSTWTCQPLSSSTPHPARTPPAPARLTMILFLPMMPCPPTPVSWATKTCTPEQTWRRRCDRLKRHRRGHERQRQIKTWSFQVTWRIHWRPYWRSKFCIGLPSWHQKKPLSRNRWTFYMHIKNTHICTWSTEAGGFNMWWSFKKAKNISLRAEEPRTNNVVLWTISASVVPENRWKSCSTKHNRRDPGTQRCLRFFHDQLSFRKMMDADLLTQTEPEKWGLKALR